MQLPRPAVKRTQDASMALDSSWHTGECRHGSRALLRCRHIERDAPTQPARANHALQLPVRISVILSAGDCAAPSECKCGAARSVVYTCRLECVCYQPRCTAWSILRSLALPERSRRHHIGFLFFHNGDSRSLIRFSSSRGPCALRLSARSENIALQQCQVQLLPHCSGAGWPNTACP